MLKMLTCGVDTGKFGACTVIEGENTYFFDHILDGDPSEIIRDVVLQFPALKTVVIETPLALPIMSRKSVASSFTNFGEWLGAIKAFGLSTQIETPHAQAKASWQRKVGLNPSDPKQTHIDLALKKYPTADLGHEVFKLRKDQPRLDGRADSLLLATLQE